ncbi:glycosyltransferase family 9 protein [bacterium]|nr:glycosyltransferase family 9 protein [bacterium]
MKISLLKSMDSILTLLLNFVLTLLRPRSRSLSKPDQDGGQTRHRTTIIKILGLGSLLHLAPRLEQFKKERPDTCLTLITSKDNLELVRMLPVIDRVIGLEIHAPFRLLADLISLYRHYRNEPADELYDAEFLTGFSCLLSGLIEARWKIGFQADTRRDTVFDRVTPLDESGHIKADFCRLLALKQTGPLFPTLELGKSASEQPADTERFVLPIGINLNVSSVALERRWPPVYFQRLLEYIARQRPDAVFILTGLPHEARFVRQFISDCPIELQQKCRISAGKTSLLELISLFQQFKLFISADSGPLALALSLDRPTLSFWGPETPQRYGPQHADPKHLVFYAGIACSPCLLARNNKTPPCHGQNKCMAALTPELVIDRLEQTNFLETWLAPNPDPGAERKD